MMIHKDLRPQAQALYEQRLRVLKAQGFTITPDLDHAVAVWSRVVVVNRFIASFENLTVENQKRRQAHLNKHSLEVQKILDGQDRT